jgi:hypothetical protein
MEAEPMRVLQFAKRSVVTVAFVSLSLAGCGGDSTPDAPFNPAGTTADLEAMNTTFASPAFASFSTFSLMFDGALGSSPVISASAAALDVGKNLARAEQGGTQEIRAAALRSAQRLAAIMKVGGEGLSTGQAMMSIPVSAAGKTFEYDLSTGGYIASDRPLLASNTVRFILYAVDPVSFAPIDPLVETGYVDLIDLSAGTTQAARVLVVSGTTTYVDYTVSVSSGTSSGQVSVIGYVTDGTYRANINLRSTMTFTSGLTLTYSLDLPERDVSIDLTVNASDLSQTTGTVTISLSMRGPNGTVSMSGQFGETGGTLAVRINGDAFATITTTSTTTAITRSDGTPLADDELQALGGVFELQADAFTSFDQMLAPVGAILSQTT